MTLYVFTHATRLTDTEHGCDTSMELIAEGEPVCLSPEYVARIKEFATHIAEDTIWVSSCQEVTMNLMSAKVKYERYAKRTTTT